jgi:UDP-N-acetyl-D-mannosaminuronic acid dehydrogenase
MQFAIANQFFQICLEKGIDWENVWNALQYKYPRATALPRPGFAAGPCLVKDTQQLNYFYENKFDLGKTALVVNEGLPDFIVGKLREMYELSEKTIGILGMTFKGDIDDFRDSLSFRLKYFLEKESKKVLCSDAKLQKDYFVTVDKLLEECDIIIIGTPHEAYRDIVTIKPIIDVWRLTKNRSIF